MRPTTADVHIPSALSNVSIAYRNAEYIAEQIFPNVPVKKQTDKYFTFTKGDWFRNEAGPRAPNTRGPEGGYSLGNEQYTTYPISFTTLVSDETEANADDVLQPRRTAVEFCTDKVLLNKEKQVADLVFGAGSWSASATPGTTWDDPASDPMKDIEEGKEALVKAVGREANVVVMGREVWTDLKRHPDLLDVFKYSRRGMITLAEFQSLFEFPKVLVGKSIITTTPEDAQDPSSGVLAATTVSFSFVWGKSMWIGWVPPAAAIAVPAAGYVFTWGGRGVESFRREEEKTTAYRAEENFDVKVTSADAGYEFISCVA